MCLDGSVAFSAEMSTYTKFWHAESDQREWTGHQTQQQTYEPREARTTQGYHISAPVMLAVRTGNHIWLLHLQLNRIERRLFD